MAARYSDEEIEALIREPKPLPADLQSQIKLRDKRGHKEAELSVQGSNGNDFRLIVRQNNINRFDFSVILGILPPDTTQLFRLRRYNGKSHEHSNPIERDAFYDFHIHYATQRYQEYGTREDTYAEPTDKYHDLYSALNSMVSECGFQVPQDGQHNLFEVSNDK